MNDTTPPLPSLDLLKTQFSERDGFMRALGAELVEMDRGSATIRMKVREESLNFNGTCHGGAIFAMADCAFGVASHSLKNNPKNWPPQQKNCAVRTIS